MATLNQINSFLEHQPIALAGVSRNPKKFGYLVFKELKEKGMDVLPVNPSADEIMGEKSYSSINALPQAVQGVIITTNKKQTASVVREIKEKGIKHVWVQQYSDSKEAIGELKDSDINYITGECILMHYKADKFHKFHKTLRKFIRRFPK